MAGCDAVEDRPFRERGGCLGCVAAKRCQVTVVIVV